MATFKSLYDTQAKGLPDFIPVGQEPWRETPDTLPADFNFDQSQSALAQSQSLLDKTRAFQTPLTAFARGDSQSALDIAKGAGKQALSDISLAGLQHAGPVGAQIMSEAKAKGGGAAKFAGAIESFGEAMKPTSPEQAIGGGLTTLAEVVAPAGLARTAIQKVGKVTGISEYFAARAEKRAVESAIKAITPRTADLTPTEYEALLRQKRITPKTMFKPSTYVLSDAEKTTATKYKDILQDKDSVQNSIKLMNKIADEDADVGNFLRQNNAIFNGGELRNAIARKMEDITDVTVPEERIVKLKEQIIDNFLGSLKKNDMESLWQARKEFDRQIENAFSGSPTLQKEVKKRFRKAIQDYISENTPDGIYKAKMKDMSNLFDLAETVETKAAKEKGINAIQTWIKENPTKAKVIGAGATIGGGGVIWNVAN